MDDDRGRSLTVGTDVERCTPASAQDRWWNSLTVGLRKDAARTIPVPLSHLPSLIPESLCLTVLTVSVGRTHLSDILCRRESTIIEIHVHG